jgi:hypothetical protein
MSHVLTIFLLSKEAAESFLGKLVSNGFTVTPALNENKALRYNENNIGCAVYVNLSHDLKFEKSHDVICEVIKTLELSHFGYNYRADNGASYVDTSNIPRTKKVIKTHKKSENNIIDFEAFRNKDGDDNA